MSYGVFRFSKDIQKTKFRRDLFKNISECKIIGLGRHKPSVSSFHVVFSGNREYGRLKTDPTR